MKCGNAENADLTYTLKMGRPRKAEHIDSWPKRSRFVALLDAKLAAGASYQEIAKALGLSSTRSLEQEFRTTRRPGRNTLEKAAPYFEVNYWDLDGPASDDEFGYIMGILGKNLTTKARVALIELAKEGQTKNPIQEEVLENGHANRVTFGRRITDKV